MRLNYWKVGEILIQQEVVARLVHLIHKITNVI